MPSIPSHFKPETAFRTARPFLEGNSGQADAGLTARTISLALAPPAPRRNWSVSWFRSLAASLVLAHPPDDSTGRRKNGILPRGPSRLGSRNMRWPSMMRALHPSGPE